MFVWLPKLIKNWFKNKLSNSEFNNGLSQLVWSIRIRFSLKLFGFIQPSFCSKQCGLLWMFCGVENNWSKVDNCYTGLLKQGYLYIKPLFWAESYKRKRSVCSSEITVDNFVNYLLVNNETSSFIDMQSLSINGIGKLRLMQIGFRCFTLKHLQSTGLGLVTRVQYLSLQIFIFYSIKNIC